MTHEGWYTYTCFYMLQTSDSLNMQATAHKHSSHCFKPSLRVAATLLCSLGGGVATATNRIHAVSRAAAWPIVAHIVAQHLLTSLWHRQIWTHRDVKPEHRTGLP